MGKVRFVKYLDTSNSIYQAPTAYDISGDYYPAADYADLEQRLVEIDSENGELKHKLKGARSTIDILKGQYAGLYYDYEQSKGQLAEAKDGYAAIIQQLHLDVAERDAEIMALKAALGGLVALEEWDTYELGRDQSSAAPYWCQLYKDGTLQGQGIGMTLNDAIKQAFDQVAALGKGE